MQIRTSTMWKLCSSVLLAGVSFILMSSSHREAPLIADDPLADNTDVYAFASPDKPGTVTIIANYNPAQLPWGGPNYNHFGENIRYEIHIDNDVNTPGDDITYRFTFKRTNEDPTTFFNIRLGKENIKNTYTLERSMDGGKSFQTIVSNGKVPPVNIGPRSINSPVGLGKDYQDLVKDAMMTASTGEKVFCGPRDDPFFVDLGGIFDLGDAPRTDGSPSSDGLKCLNVSTIAIQVDVATLQKNHKSLKDAKTILDPDYVIGVWASASRRAMRVLNANGNGQPSETGKWVQVSRLGMPLTNEAVIPIGYKDYWNSLTPYDDLSKFTTFAKFFQRPELALYMDDHFYGGAVPAFKPLRIQRNSLGKFGFGNDQNGLYPLKNSAAVKGTALDDAVFGKLLLPFANAPRSVDLYPIFHTGVPNLLPYQLATGKNGNPLASGKPFINNFLPNGGDMLRLNMAVPATPRDSKDFNNLGLVWTAVLGLTDSRYNTSTKLENIPNMDGFPNGRRLEDDVTRIELQAVSGVVLAAVGLPYDDYTGGPSPVTPDLLKVINYNTGINNNDTTLRIDFPYEQTPWSGKRVCNCSEDNKQNERNRTVATANINEPKGLQLATPELFLSTYPNPSVNTNMVRYHAATASNVSISVYDINGRQMKILVNKQQQPGDYSVEWSTKGMTKGMYYVNGSMNGTLKQTLKLVKE